MQHHKVYKIYEKNKKDGIIGNYIYKIKNSKMEDKRSTIMLVEDKNSVVQIKCIYVYAIIGSLIALIVIFVISKKLSNMIVRPVEETIEKQKTFISDASHELKTPITSIMGYADTLLESDYDKEMQTKFLEVISSEARRMARLVTDLLVLSRYDNKKVTKEESVFDLGELTKNCIDRLRFEVEKKNHNVECFVTANVPPVNADKYGIERVILNIISNAIKYTPENGVIKVYVGFVYNDAYIKVIDNGIGIPEADLSRIFERFYRVDKARSRELGGTGLGLPIAKEIIEQNNGSIDIKSEAGKGTEVVIRIPVYKK